MTFTLAKVIINNLIEPPRSKDVDTEYFKEILLFYGVLPGKKPPVRGQG